MIRIWMSFYLGFVIIQNAIFAQDPHIFTRYSSQPEISFVSKALVDSIPYFKPQNGLKSTKDVVYVDNSTLKYFPAIFNQRGNSCSQASGIRNVFTYEMNFIRNQSASSNSNVYSYHYTWNFLNEGKDYGSWYHDGFSLVKDNGVPNISDFPDESGKTTEKTWISGYDKYYRAMKNRIDSYFKIDAGAGDGLDLIKQYLIDHGDGSSEGSVIVFSGKSSNWDLFNYTGPSNTGYHYAIRKFGDGGDHAMTIVGFDDAVTIDVNNDGTIQDDEKGALIIVNTWGSNWGSNGRAYISYKLLSMNWFGGGIGNGDHYVYLLKAKDHTPSVTAKIKISYTSRNDLWVILGVAKEANATNQERAKTMKIFKKQGGDNYMQGSTDATAKTIEIGLDLSDLIESIPDAKKFFLSIKQSLQGDLGNGQVVSFSILDYRNSTTPEEYISPDENVTISGTAQLTAAKVLTGIDDNSFAESTNIYPNPVMRGNCLNISFKKSYLQESLKIDLISLEGITIKSFQVLNQDQNIELEIPESLNSGIYFVRITDSRDSITKTIIVN